MSINTQLHRIAGFVTNFVFDLKIRLIAFSADLRSLNKLSRKSLAFVLMASMLLPMIFLGQAKPVYAAPSPINSSAVSQSFPNPYDFPDSGFKDASAHLFSPAAFLGIRDYISSLFGSSESSFDGCPTGYASLGGIINSDPTASVFAGKIFVFVRGTDGAVYYQTTTGSSFSGYNSLGGIITSNPASASDGSSLVVEATGTDSNRYYQTTTNGFTFSGWMSGTLTTQTNASVGFNGQNYTFVKGTGTEPPLCYQAVTPTPTPTPTPTAPPSSPNSAPVQTATTLPTSTNLSRVRLAPVNGTGGTNPYSRNFGWGTSLAGLSGRGMNAGFGISYNSLIWTRVGNDMVFNPNQDNVTPGFRFGYPVIEPSYSDPITNKNTFLMVAPSGTRVEFRQLPASNDTYETVDSSYVQLKVIDANNVVVTDTSGTNAYYELKAGTFRVASIKDRNGNYISVSHDTSGRLQSVTDTLGRVIGVGYDSEGTPASITQSRSTGTFTYASLTYSNITLGTNFAGLNTVGIAGTGTFRALTKITYPDGSSTQFDYNAYGQVWKVSNYSAQNNVLNYTAINVQNVTGAQTDVPRFSEIRNWAKNFNLDASGNAQETVTSIVYQENAGFILPNNTTVSGTLLHVTAPDGTISRNFIGGTTTGWQEGLPILLEDWANESNVWNRKRWNYSVYTQDDTNLAYPLNPRVIESKIGDSANIRRSTIEYWTQTSNPNAALFGLTKEVKVYDADQTTVLKRSKTDYVLDSAYLSRRIIGLPQNSELYGQNNSLMSKVTYQYDEGNFSGANQTIAPIQHDTTNFGAGFIAGRGNLTSTTRWDVDNLDKENLAISSYAKYDIAGNQVASIDPLGRTVSISYADSYDDNQNRSSYAYPTQVTDPANNSSTVKYRFDIGANVYATSPAPAGNTVGKTTSRIYDSIGRLQQETVNNTGAYTRYEYPLNGTQSLSYSTIVDKLNNGADTSDEVVTESNTDGAGRVISSRTEHPGSVGEWAATRTIYDVMGRVKSSSVPTEVNGSWQPAGDDATRGWLWTTNEYDWKGRITRTINTDLTDKLYSYEGCGCAGGQVTTIQSELVPRDDNPSLTARRTQKFYADILGRDYKTETLNWNGSIYATTKSYFNALDQVTSVRQYVGSEASPTYQDTYMIYDGHGRLSMQHRPEQNMNTWTVYKYNKDDSVQSVTDARGAKTSYVYNSRKLLENINYSVPANSTIPVTPNVSFSYDNLGNRTQMTDGLGTVVYDYNQLSQLTAETRSFTESLPNAPLAGNSFKLQYAYSLSGQLTSLTDPYNQQINYGHDKTGRLQSVTGSTFGGVTSYASNPHYRAWGALQNLTYGNGVQMNMAFNDRLQAANYTLVGAGASSWGNLMQKQYQYYADGALKYVQDQLDPKFDRFNAYDQVGRIVAGKSGAEARGQTVAQQDQATQLPYNQSYQYNAFGNLTERNNKHWGLDYYAGQSNNLSYSYQNNRVQGATYDPDGRMTITSPTDGNSQSIYDIAGRSVRVTESGASDIYRSYDSSRREVKRRTFRWTEDPNSTTSPGGQWADEGNTFFIRSSVLGNQTISEVDGQGKKLKTFVKANGATLATQSIIDTTQKIDYQHYDAAGTSYKTTNSTGANDVYPGTMFSPAELDPMGGNVGIETPYVQVVDPGPPPFEEMDNRFLLTNEAPMRVNGQRLRCFVDGFELFGGSGCGAAISLVGRSLDIDFGNSDRSALRALGIYATVTRISGSDRLEPPIDTTDTLTVNSTGTNDRFIIDYYGIGSWDIRRSPVIEHPSRRVSTELTIFDAARAFIKTDEKCKNFLNDVIKQLSKDTGIVLDGDIEYYLDQLERTGTVNVVTLGKTADGSITMPHGEAVGDRKYGTPGWGFNIGIQTTVKGNQMFNANMSVFFGELIHSIGAQDNGKKPDFGDDYAAKALENMGVAISMEEYTKLPQLAGQLQINAQGIPYIPFGESKLWHGIVSYMCGGTQGKPLGLKN